MKLNSGLAQGYISRKRSKSRQQDEPSQAKRNRLSLISPEIKYKRRLERIALNDKPYETLITEPPRNLTGEFIESFSSVNTLNSLSTDNISAVCSSSPEKDNEGSEGQLVTYFLDELIASGIEDDDQEVSSSNNDNEKEIKIQVIIIVTNFHEIKLKFFYSF
jgi:hypothetical protein